MSMLPCPVTGLQFRKLSENFSPPEVVTCTVLQKTQKKWLQKMISRPNWTLDNVAVDVHGSIIIMWFQWVSFSHWKKWRIMNSLLFLFNLQLWFVIRSPFTHFVTKPPDTLHQLIQPRCHRWNCWKIEVSPGAVGVQCDYTLPYNRKEFLHL